MTRRTIADMAHTVVVAVRTYVADALGPVEHRQEDLERRLRALETRFESERKGFFYRGVWAEGESYEEGDFASHQGGLWHCNRPTSERPGSGDAWQLAVKSGRNGRDARARR